MIMVVLCGKNHKNAKDISRCLFSALPWPALQNAARERACAGPCAVFLKILLRSSPKTDLLPGLLSDVIPQARIISISEPGDNLSGWPQMSRDRIHR